MLLRISFKIGFLIFAVNSCVVTSICSQTFSLYINEILTSNIKSQLSPEFSEYADWIELYNSGTSAKNIGGCYLTDDSLNKTKWIIPVNTTMAAKGYLVFWADKHNEGIHTNFELNKGGEFIGFFDPDGLALDTFSFGPQKNDISYGRLAGNPRIFGYFDTLTPGSQNSDIYYPGIASLPQFLPKGGFYKGGSLTVKISTNTPSATIRYTLDATLPTDTSKLYTDSLSFNSTAIIRACVFEAGKLSSDIITQTYFINEPVNLPFVSIVTDPANLFDNKIGIYVTGTNGAPGTCDGKVRNLNQDWERPVNIELYEQNGQMALNQAAGIKIYGGCSRTRYPQKSFALYARNEYGKGSFDYRLFPDKPIDKFESFILRSSADDQVFAFLRDALAQNVIVEYMDADIQAYRPVVVFINGAYWGIHDLREKISEHYIAENFNVNPDDINILEKDVIVNIGNAAGYTDILDYIKSHDLGNNNNYKYVQTQMDINQFIDYQIAHIYLAEKGLAGKQHKILEGKYRESYKMALDMLRYGSNINVYRQKCNVNSNCT